jgi:hypothetical protein
VSWERVAWVAAYRSGAPSRCIRGSASPPRLPTTLTSNRIGRREKASGKPSHLFLLPVRLGRRCKARHSLSELADAHEAAFEDTTILDALNEDSRYLYLIATRPTANILSPTSSDTTEHYRVGGSCTHPYPACNKHGGLRKPTTQCLELFYHLLIMEVIEDPLRTWVATTLPAAGNCCRHPS